MNKQHIALAFLITSIIGMSIIFLQAIYLDGHQQKDSWIKDIY